MRGDPYRSQRGTRSSPFSERSNAGPRENLGKKLFEHDLQLAILYIQSSVDVRKVLPFLFTKFCYLSPYSKVLKKRCTTSLFRHFQVSKLILVVCLCSVDVLKTET